MSPSGEPPAPAPRPVAPGSLEHTLATFFGQGGPLRSALPGYQERPEQVALAVGIGRAIQRERSLVAEAGTGTGKSLAYLLPALASGLKVIVSTGTKNLQEQLLHKDLPILERATGRTFDVVVLKGRSNYLCEARFERHAEQLALPGLAGRDLWSEVRAWRERTHSGDRAELSGLPDDAPLWRELTVTSEQCTGRRCPQYERCWVTRVRRRAQESQLVVVNHHLYFADCALRGRAADSGVSILPPHDLVIFDEAHELEDIASQYFGYQVSERRVAELGHDIEAALGPEVGSDAAATLRALLAQLELASHRLFDALPFPAARAGGRARLDPGGVARAADAHHTVDQLLEEVEGLLGTLEGEELPPMRRRCAQLGAELAFVLDLPRRASILGEVKLGGADGEASLPFVRFVETSPSGRNRTVAARPLEVAPLVRGSLGERPAIFTSATLAVGGRLDHFKARLGVEDADDLVARSPFDYQRQSRLYLPDDLPDVDDPRFVEEASARIVALINASGGGAFVLCTSTRMLDNLARALRRGTSATVLTQGSAPRTHLIERFRADGDAVLVATMSFWRGVDVPGRALRLVILDRLPFASPGDPVVAARLDHVARQGGSPFRDHQLPQASLLLRQGFGRLIRNEEDRGLVAILDRRIVRKGYGRALLRDLPPCPVLRDTAEACSYLRDVRDAP